MRAVLTVDQRSSRRSADRVGDVLARLAGTPVVRGFERTAGDEFQGVLDDPQVVVDVALALVRDGGWSIGIGIGAVEEPLPASTRAGRGEAFALARAAVEAAKKRPQHVAVRGADTDAADDAQALLTLLAVVVQRRSKAAWAALEAVEHAGTITAAATRLGISRQAVGQRLAAGLWDAEREARPVAARLLGGAGG
ncbi:MAG: hypothetical protein ACKVZ6_22525 [Kineosporiaceae bacterium]|jgi:hypothetical protein